jgi:hypothetical protein
MVGDIALGAVHRDTVHHGAVHRGTVQDTLHDPVDDLPVVGVDVGEGGLEAARRPRWQTVDLEPAPGPGRDVGRDVPVPGPDPHPLPGLDRHTVADVHTAREPALRPPVGAAFPPRPSVGPVPAQHPDLHLRHRPRAGEQDLLDQLDRPVLVLGVQQLSDRDRCQLLHRPPQHGGERETDRHEVAVEIGDRLHHRMPGVPRTLRRTCAAAGIVGTVMTPPPPAPGDPRPVGKRVECAPAQPVALPPCGDLPATGSLTGSAPAGRTPVNDLAAFTVRTSTWRQA